MFKAQTMKNASEATDTIDTEREERKLVTESLLLPSTSIGRTTSATICERSNVWAEHRLAERKHNLDSQLYKSVIKMNVDKLEVVEELAKLKKSASTGSIETLLRRKQQREALATIARGSPLVSVCPTTSLNKGKTQRNLSKAGTKTGNSKQAKSSFKITIGTDSCSSDTSEDESSKYIHNDLPAENKQCRSAHCAINSNGGQCKVSDHGTARPPSSTTKILSMTSCSIGRECSNNRAQIQKFENATRRYAQITTKKSKQPK